MFKKRYYKFTERLMFAIVMRDEELCRELLERIIPERKVRQIRFPKDPAMDYLTHLLTGNDRTGSETGAEAATVEKTIITGLFSKSVRLDVLFEDDAAWYAIEMQVKMEPYLPQRTRYYHASMAVEMLDAGHSYSELKPGYVIFICMFDFFEAEESIYRFQMMEEKKFLPLGDGQFTIMVNMACPEENVPEELRTFYSFVNHGEVADKDAFICKIHDRVEQANRSREVQNIMTVEDEIRMQEHLRINLEKEIEKLGSTNQNLSEEREHLEAANQKLSEEREHLELKQKLTELLLQQNRFDDLKQMVKDEDYLNRLLQELQLS